MGADTKIEWADHTFNPWIGCTRISNGRDPSACDNCYAESLARRYGWAKWGPGEPRRFAAASTWKHPRKWDRDAKAAGVRRRVFCASLADVFDAEVDDDWRIMLLEEILATPNLDWLLLTKRPQVAKKFFDDIVPRNVWLGTTVESQAMADLRIPTLLSVPAPVHFLSCEPLLGPVDLTRWLDRTVNGRYHAEPILDWIIAGGESGPKARPSHPDWFRALRDQCAAAGVPYFFKQWGEWAPSATVPIEQRLRREVISVLPDGAVREWQTDYPDARLTSPEMASMCQVGKKAAGALLDGREWREVPS